VAHFSMENPVHFSAKINTFAIFGRRDAYAPNEGAPEHVRIGETATRRHLLRRLAALLEKASHRADACLLDPGRRGDAHFAME
jgi:hypothetical protein